MQLWKRVVNNWQLPFLNCIYKVYLLLAVDTHEYKQTYKYTHTEQVDAVIIGHLEIIHPIFTSSQFIQVLTMYSLKFQVCLIGYWWQVFFLLFPSSNAKRNTSLAVCVCIWCNTCTCILHLPLSLSLSLSIARCLFSLLLMTPLFHKRMKKKAKLTSGVKKKKQLRTSVANSIHLLLTWKTKSPCTINKIGIAGREREREREDKEKMTMLKDRGEERKRVERGSKKCKLSYK